MTRFSPLSRATSRMGAHRARPLGTLGAGALLAIGCTAYRPAPIDPFEVLRELNEVAWTPSTVSTATRLRDSQAGAALSLGELVALAVEHNPTLRALRAEAGVAAAQLVEAGLLPDPEVAWDAMDALAPQWVEGDADTVDFASGSGLSWLVPRPGEIPARVGRAEAEVDEVRYRILRGEWLLARDIALAWLDVVGAQMRLDLNARLIDIARRTQDYFARAFDARAATALQANLADVALAEVELDRVRLEVEIEKARQVVNSLLGLPPETVLPLEMPEDALAIRPLDRDAFTLTELAVASRPDVSELLARYRQAEETLRLEVARQWPQVTIGTGLAISLPIFTRFNQPAIRTALASRERMKREVVSAIHELRREVHAAVIAVEQAQRELDFLEGNLGPRVEKSLELTDQAFQAREVTLVEILTAQGQVLDAQSRLLEARIGYARARLSADGVTGALSQRLLPRGGDKEHERDEE